MKIEILKTDLRYVKYALLEVSLNKNNKLREYDKVAIVNWAGETLVSIKVSKSLPFYMWRKGRAIKKAIQIWKDKFRATQFDLVHSPNLCPDKHLLNEK